jgi:hypothetical protein
MAKNENKIKENSGQDYVALSHAAHIAGCTPEHLNLMVRRGKLKAEKLGRNWYTKESWLEEYILKTDRTKKLRKGIIPVRLPDTEEEKKPEEAEKKALPKTVKKKDPAIYVREDVDEKRKQKLKKFAGIYFPVFSSVIIAAVLFFIIPLVRFEIKKGNELEKTFEGIDQISFFNENEGVVLGEESEAAGEENKGIAMASEKFKLRQARFGGDVEIIKEDDAPLKIENIRSETYLTKNQEESKLVISWETNKQAISEIEYSKNDGSGTRKLREGGYGFNHGVVIPGLELGTAYVYRINAKDKWGNEEQSGNFAVYSGSKAVSVVELIAAELEKMFGWTKMNK